MELDSAHQLQVDCGQQAELAHQHGAFCADHMPVEMWWEVFQYLDDYDPVLRMSFSFWKLVTVPSVCKLWHTMLLGERKMHKAQLQMYMRIRPLPDDVLSITVPKGMLAEPWLSRYVRNIEAPISKGSVLDFISTMLSGGTTQTKLDLRKWIYANSGHSKGGSHCPPTDGCRLGVTFWHAHLGDSSVLRTIADDENKIWFLLKNGHVQESIRYWKQQALQSEVKIVDMWLATVDCRPTTEDLAKQWHDFVELCGPHSTAHRGVSWQALAGCTDEQLAVLIALKMANEGNLCSDNNDSNDDNDGGCAVRGINCLAANETMIKFAVTDCLVNGYIDLARTFIGISGRSCRSMAIHVHHIYLEVCKAWKTEHTGVTGHKWRKLVYFMLECCSGNLTRVFDDDPGAGNHFYHCLGMHGDAFLAHAIPCPKKHWRPMITGCIQGMNDTTLDFLLKQRAIATQSMMYCALKFNKSHQHQPGKPILHDPYPALLQIGNRHLTPHCSSSNNNESSPSFKQEKGMRPCYVAQSDLKALFERYPLRGAPILQLMRLINPNVQHDYPMFIAALMQQPGNEHAIGSLLRILMALPPVDVKALGLLFAGSMRIEPYLEVFLSSLSPSIIDRLKSQLLMKKKHRGPSSALYNLVSGVKRLKANTHNNRKRSDVIRVLARHLPKECMDSMERCAFPKSCSDADSLRVLRALLKARGFLLPETWPGVIFLATARTRGHGQDDVWWDEPDANLLRVATGRHRDCAPTLLKLLCGHPNVLKDVDCLERARRLAPHDLCHLCGDPRSVPPEQRVVLVMECLKHFKDSLNGNKKNERFLEQLLAAVTREEVEHIATIAPFEVCCPESRRFLKRYCQENMIHPDRKAFASKRHYDFVASFYDANFRDENDGRRGIKRLRLSVLPPAKEEAPPPENIPNV